MTHMPTHIGTWIGFILASVASLVAYATAWSRSYYLPLLTCLAAIALVMGLAALRQTGARPWSLAAVLGGLIVGQWGLIQWLLVVAFGKWRGFAP